MTRGDASCNLSSVPESAAPTGTGEPSLEEVTFGWRTPENGPGPRFGKVVVSGIGTGRVSTEPPREPDRFAGRRNVVVGPVPPASHPNWLGGATVLTAPERCLGPVRGSVTAS